MGMIKHSQSFQNSKFAMTLQYLKKQVRDEIDFLHSNKVSYRLISTLIINFFYNMILSLWMSMIKYSQSIQSTKFAISLQYLKK